ncbi:MAG: hypothetical protein AAGF11_12710 [Myxococcota bacterium]
MPGEPKKINVAMEWFRLVPNNATMVLEPPVYVLPVPGGMLFRVVVPGNPMVFVPNVSVAALGVPS